MELTLKKVLIELQPHIIIVKELTTQNVLRDGSSFVKLESFTNCKAGNYFPEDNRKNR